MSKRSVREEFNEWAVTGKGAEMAEGHLNATLKLIENITLKPTDHCLDIGCGIGWASNLLRERGAGRVMGIDLCEEMIARTRPLPGVSHRLASMTEMPFADDRFNLSLSIEQIYYVLDLDRGLAELRRVLRPGGRALFMLDLYGDNPVSPIWVRELPVDVHCLSAEQWCERLRAAGFESVEHFRALSDKPPTPREEFEPSRWEPTYEDHLAWHEAGSLLLIAQ